MDLFHMLKLIYAEIQIVIKSHTCFVIFFFESESEREEILSLSHKCLVSMSIHSESAWNSSL